MQKELTEQKEPKEKEQNENEKKPKENNSECNELKAIKPCEDMLKFQVIFTMLYSVLLKLCGDKYIETSNKVMIELFHIDEPDISY